MHKPEEYGLEETQKFIPLESSEPSTKIVDPNVLTQAFNGLSKNEIIKYGSDPFWVKIRWAIFAVFWLAWIGMLVLAVFIVVFTPKCPYRPKLQWWQSEVIYQLDVMKFKDSDGDGIGDLQGAIEKLNYVNKLGAKVVCLNENWLDSQDPLKIRVDIGSENKMRELKKTLEEKDMYLMLDIPVSALNTNDNEILSKWLTDYADGIRITQLDKWAADDKDKKEKLNKWVKIGQDIFDKTFKAKMVMFYPYTQKKKDVLTPGLIVNQNFLKIKDSDLKDSTKFIENSQFNETSYILNDFSTTERIRDRLNGTGYHSIYHGLVLLLKGTPMILYGDELEYTKADKNMKWDNSKPACGFTTQNKTIDDCSNTVKHAQSYGSNKELLKMYERLIKLRRNEPSFKWGSIKTKNDSVNVVSYVREADRFDGFVIIGNLDNERHLVDLEQRHSLPNDAKVEYYHAADGIPNPDFSQNQVVHTDNVQVKPGDLIVLRFSREPDSGNSKSSEVAAAHG